MNVGSTIRKLREARNVTQEYMAAQLNIGVTAYGNIERSDVKRLTVARVVEIASILNVHYSEIFGFREKHLPDPRRANISEANMLAMMEYFRKDKQLLCDMLQAYKELYIRVDQMLQENNKTLHRLMKMQQEIHQNLLSSKRRGNNETGK